MFSTSSFELCKNITETLKKQPLNQYFLFPVDPENDGLADYFDIITEPMDLSTIENKLTTNQYQNEYQWYKDVCLIYENAMKYHPEGSIYYLIAQYCLNSFKKMSFEIESASGTLQSWYDAVSKQTQKLSSILLHHPTNKSIDPQVTEVINKCKTMDPVSLSSIDDITKKLNDLMKKQQHRYNMVSIIKELEPSINIDADDLRIPISTLSQETLNAVYLYSQSI